MKSSSSSTDGFSAELFGLIFAALEPSSGDDSAGGAHHLHHTGNTLQSDKTVLLSIFPQMIMGSVTMSTM